jgi:hypothetical protein
LVKPLIIAWLTLSPASAQTGDTGPATETGVATDTAGTTDDTAAPACADCVGAADLAQDEGGSPCTGCQAVQGRPLWVMLGGAFAAIARTRRRR